MEYKLQSLVRFDIIRPLVFSLCRKYYENRNVKRSLHDAIHFTANALSIPRTDVEEAFTMFSEMVKTGSDHYFSVNVAYNHQLLFKLYFVDDDLCIDIS